MADSAQIQRNFNPLIPTAQEMRGPDRIGYKVN